MLPPLGHNGESSDRQQSENLRPLDKMRLLCLLLLFGCTLAIDYAGYGCSDNPYIRDAGPLVRTSSGSLFGKYVKVFDTKVAAFLGIPYANPPVSEKRFLKPTPLEHWDGVLDATVKPPPCMQYSSRNFSWIPKSTPSEDCLYLNVWTPAKCCCSGSEKLPVMVWIYGGGFYSGSTDMDVYDGSTMVSYSKAIVVSINYRVGIFGFLNSGSDEAPGNMGLLDQNLALKWIKKNIGYFGGDPERITIMGESAGAMSVSLHMVSPLSRNLFQAAILQSATAYQPQMVDNKAVSYIKANTFAKVIGCLHGNSSIESDPEVMECLKAKSSWELARAEDAFTSKFPQYFLPTYGDEFLPTSPFKAFNEGHLAPVDILIGNNRDEVTIFLNYMVPDIFRLDSEPQLNLEAAKQIIEGLFQTVPRPSSTEIFQHYFQNVSGDDSSEIVQTIAHAFGDYVFYCPVALFAEKARNAYVYWVSHRSMRDQNPEWLGVPHFYEVPFVFGVPIQDTFTYTPEDGRFSADLIKKWTTFAEHGHPLGDRNPEEWPPYSAENPMAYELNPRQRGLINFPRAEACEFWRPYIVPKTC